jgi:hypothetical protein
MTALADMQQRVLATMEGEGYVRDEASFERGKQQILVLRKPHRDDREIVQILAPNGQVFPLVDTPPADEDPYDSGVFLLRISLGNDAMCTGHDVLEALRVVADRIMSEQSRAGSISDRNGRTVGEWGKWDSAPAALDEARDEALLGAETDGEHHKQYSLMEIARLLGADERMLADLEPGIPG